MHGVWVGESVKAVVNKSKRKSEEPSSACVVVGGGVD